MDENGHRIGGWVRRLLFRRREPLYRFTDLAGIVFDVFEDGRLERVGFDASLVRPPSPVDEIDRRPAGPPQDGVSSNLRVPGPGA